MQISDLLNQYNQNIANGTEISPGVKGLKQVMSSFQEMAVGNIFEGNIMSMEDGVVTLGLPNGHSIQAKLDANVSLSLGQTLFFQVKSNNGTEIAIRPMVDGMGSNPTLLNALDAAGLTANARNLGMVDAMMQQSMPIDKQSLQDMMRLLMNHPDINPRTVVEMSKLLLPVTEEMVAQFENYKSDQHAVIKQLDEIMKDLPQKLSSGALSTKGMLELNHQILDILAGGNGTPEGTEFISPHPEKNLQQNVKQLVSQLLQADFSKMAEGTVKQGISELVQVLQQMDPGQLKMDSLQMDLAQLGEKILQQGNGQITGESLLQEIRQLTEKILQSGTKQPTENPLTENQPKEMGQVAQDIQKEVERTQLEALPVKELFQKGEQKQLAAYLSRIPQLAEHPGLFTPEGMDENTDAKELLRLIGEAFANAGKEDIAGLKELASSKHYRKLLLNAMEQQWLMRPEEVGREHKVEELYNRLERQMSQMEEVLKAAGGSVSKLSDTAAQVRSNIEFMNQVNQNYTYVQIPLKMAGKNIHSDLYVYTDKKKARDKDGELTAFLHLDMEHLGSTDISIRMQNRNVNTKFYVEEDISYELVQSHMGELQKKLEKKGYNVSVQIENQENPVNFVEDFLKKEGSKSSGTVQRYTFDVRA